MTQTDLQTAFDEEAAGARVAGLAAGVVGAGDEFQAVHGAEPTTLFRVASITKTFTAIAVMQLVEQGRIGLDDPLNTHLRSLHVQPPKDAPEITVRHALTHRAGLREPLQWSDLARPSRFVGPRTGRPVPTLPDLYGGSIRATALPGDAWSYSNDGYAVLGQLIEDVTGTPYPEHVTRAVWLPLGMTDSTFAPGPGTQVAAGHRQVRGRLREVPGRVVVKAAAGGAYCSLADMLRYASALADPASFPALAPGTLKEMLEPQVLLGDRVPFTGLGFFLDRIDGHRVVYHPGDFPGYEAALLVAPDDGAAAVVVCNSTSRGAALRLARTLLSRALEADEQVDPLSAGLADRLVGTYAAEPGWRSNMRVAGMTGGRLTVTADNGCLVLRSRFGALRSASELQPVPGTEDLHFRVQLRGMPYDRVPLDVVFAPGQDGKATRVDLGMLGARFHRR